MKIKGAEGCTQLVFIEEGATSSMGREGKEESQEEREREQSVGDRHPSDRGDAQSLHPRRAAVFCVPISTWASLNLWTSLWGPKHANACYGFLLGEYQEIHLLNSRSGTFNGSSGAWETGIVPNTHDICTWKEASAGWDKAQRLLCSVYKSQLGYKPLQGWY